MGTMRMLKQFRQFIVEWREIINPLLLFILLFISNLLAPHNAMAKFGSIVEVGLAGDFYFTKESANNGQAFANLFIQNKWSNSRLWLDVGAGGLIAEAGHSYIKAPQMYYQYGSQGQFNISFGRMKYDWSLLDNHWNIGMVQPLFSWDSAQPEVQGLSGLFVGVPLVKDKYEMMLFVSGLYIPSQGPSYELADGNLRSSNPWFSPPAQAVSFSGNEYQLEYNVDVPKVTEIVFRPSYGIALGSVQNKKGLIAKIFAINKPKNDLILPFDGALNTSTLKGNVLVRPQVGRHTVAGVDLGWNYKLGKTVLSWVYESKVDYNFNVKLDTTYPEIPEQNIYSLVQQVKLSPAQRLSFGYFHADKKRMEVKGLYASSSSVDTFQYRNRFDRAARVGWEGRLFKQSRRYRMKTKLSYTYDVVDSHSWISTDLRWAAFPGVEIFKHCDFFGGDGKSIKKNDFISNYQNNDRCYVGGHYVF